MTETMTGFHVLKNETSAAKIQNNPKKNDHSMIEALVTNIKHLKSENKLLKDKAETN